MKQLKECTNQNVKRAQAPKQAQIQRDIWMELKFILTHQTLSFKDLWISTLLQLLYCHCALLCRWNVAVYCQFSTAL